MSLKKQNGITLIVLVITIIVMLIIASTSLSMVFSNGGILDSSQKSKKAQEEYANAEEGKTDNLINDVDKQIQEEYKDISGANAPKLKEGMIPVKWVEVKVNNEVTDGSWIVTDSNDSEWYNYTDKKWANIMLTDGLQVEGIDDVSKVTLEEMKNKKVTSEGSMFVWIPRYAYQIESGYHQGGEGITGKINVEFLKGTSNTPVNDDIEIVEYNQTTTEDYTKFPDGYVVHPGFTYGEQVSGMWVAKFEASHTNCTTSASTGETDTNRTNLVLQVKPNVTSWRNIQVGNIYEVCLNYNQILNSHMMKNSEWGAVAYLTQSVYGRDREEVSVNQCRSYITGAGPGIGDSTIYNSSYEYNSSNFDSTYSYTSTQGKLASTTGNVTGIYDMNGGAVEYVATYIDNDYMRSTSLDLTYYNYGKSLIDSTDTRKIEIYNISEDYTQGNNYKANRTMYGNAMWETSVGNNGGSWYSDYARTPFSNSSFLTRGGSYGSGRNGGLFCFNNYYGSTAKSHDFRPVLIVL